MKKLELLLWRYLIQGVVGGDGHSVGVHHQPLPQQREQAVRVHDLHLPPVGSKNTGRTFGAVLARASGAADLMLADSSMCLSAATDVQ